MALQGTSIATGSIKEIKKKVIIRCVFGCAGTASLVPAQPQRYQFGTSSPLLDARACARTRTREEIAKHLKSSAITAGGPPDPQLSLNCLGI